MVCHGSQHQGEILLTENLENYAVIHGSHYIPVHIIKHVYIPDWKLYNIYAILYENPSLTSHISHVSDCKTAYNT